MNLYKVLNQTIDLDHVLAVSDFDPARLGFEITLALRTAPLRFYLVPVPQARKAHAELLAAWAARGACKIDFGPDEKGPLYFDDLDPDELRDGKLRRKS